MTVNALIIDDSELDRYILKRWLKSCSFDSCIVEATDGEDALEFFDHSAEAQTDGYPPTIIFLDINMPRLNGFEFLERFANIRGKAALQSTVIVMFTSSPRQDDKDRAFQWSFVQDFIVKGEFETEDLEGVIGRLVNDRAAQPQMRRAATSR